MNDVRAHQYGAGDIPNPSDRHVEWLKRVMRWDGVLPLIVAAAAPLTNVLFPEQDAVGTLLAVFLPIAGFFLRLWIGSRYFESHYHYAWQGAVFFIAVLWLVVLDSVLILFNLIPEGIKDDDWLIWFMMYAGYVVAMAIALYPRAAPMPAVVASPSERSDSSWN